MNYRESLTLNGKTYLGEELARLISEDSNKHEKYLYSFINEWISESDVIKVKTSGTTGEPKEIIFQKNQAIASAQMTCEYFRLNKDTNALMCLSPEFIGGKMMIVRAFVSEMNLITVEPNSNPLEKLHDKIDFASMVPLQVYNGLQDAETKNKFLSIPNIIIGGAPISSALENILTGCSNNVYSTFAMTESLSHIALRKLSGQDRKDYFETLSGITISANTRDCLVINAPALNEKPIITNDMVEIIDSTHFRWLGRYDNIINSGGIKIHPEMVERKLETFMNHRFFITSLPDEKLGQKAVMVIECPKDFDKSQVINLVKETLSKYEIPKQYYRVEKFLETPTGKVKKEETQRIAAEF